MSMGNPGWNPGADALRAQQEANRLQQESARRMAADATRIAQENARIGWVNARPRRTSPAGVIARLFGVLVVLAVLVAMAVFAGHELNQRAGVPAPTTNQGCPSGALFCP
ncbi:MAG TPA: hypothetical protein VJ872_02475 [Nocardioides sp.]|nr:hypothetical protein [Nocardioides sp.]